jgi:hypothetical protein
MKNKLYFLSVAAAFAGVSLLFASCEKDYVAPAETSQQPAASASFVEEFANVGDLTSKGWVFKNNSNPIGQSGWRQGRYESASLLQYKFLAPVAYIGFPAYSAENSPNEFISCDASAVNDATTGTGDISAWLISPQVPIKNGDQIIFYTRAVTDFDYPAYTKDRMQVRANFTDGGVNVGTSPASVGNFSNLLLDINPNYIYNDPTGNAGTPGYPQAWTKYTITISGLTAPVEKARFAFRYFGTDAGVFGGASGSNYPTVVGIDSLAFVHQ